VAINGLGKFKRYN